LAKKNNTGQRCATTLFVVYSLVASHQLICRAERR